MIMASRSLQFQHPDPFSREAISRTTRYRIRKRRKHDDESDESSSLQQQDINDSSHDCDVRSDGDRQSGNGDAEFGIVSSQRQEFDDRLFADDDYDPPFAGADDLPELYPESNSYSDYDSDNEISSDYQGSADEIDVEERSDMHTEERCRGETSRSLLRVSPHDLLVKQYAMRHCLTKKALEDLLRLLRLFSSSSSVQLSPSAFVLEKPFQKLHFPVTYHYFCGDCLQQLPHGQIRSCPNCIKEFSSVGSICTFIEIPIQPQLINLFQKNSCWEAVCKQYSLRSKENTLSYCDIYDGMVYKQLFNSGFLSNCHNISLIVNIDGVPVFRSSSYSFWPIWIVVNELPYRMRYAKENRIIAGLWYGKTKPDMNLFLKPLVDSLSQLQNEGFQVRQLTCRPAVIAFTCDLPARALIMNVVQYNGFYGCPHCLQRGETVVTSKKGRVQSFPFVEQNPTGPLRSLRDHCKHVSDATESGKPVFGVKGPCWLQAIPKFDMFAGMSFDYMHCVLLGVTRLLMRLWFSSQYHKEVWYLGNSVQDIDKILCCFCPPDEIRRTPRSVTVAQTYWKAHELRAWLLHYSPVLLQQFCDTDYFQHHLLLVEGLYLLLKDVVTEDDLRQSAKLFQHYCYMFPVLYEDRYMTINVHGLMHLPGVVNNLGPLWSNSCFPFESANGDIQNFFHGSTAIEKQVVQYISVMQALPFLAANSFTKDSREEHLHYQLANESQQRSRFCNRISLSICAHGKPKPINELSQDDLNLFSKMSHTVPRYTKVTMYSQIHLLSVDRIIKARMREIKRDNSGVLFKSTAGGTCFGKFLKLMVFDEADDAKAFAVIQCLNLTKTNICKDTITNAQIDKHIISLCPQQEEKDRCVVDIKDILDKCILLEDKVHNKFIFASLFPNSKEAE